MLQTVIVAAVIFMQELTTMSGLSLLVRSTRDIDARGVTQAHAELWSLSDQACQPICAGRLSCSGLIRGDCAVSQCCTAMMLQWRLSRLCRESEVDVGIPSGGTICQETPCPWRDIAVGQ